MMLYLLWSIVDTDRVAGGVRSLLGVYQRKEDAEKDIATLSQQRHRRYKPEYRIVATTLTTAPQYDDLLESS